MKRLLIKLAFNIVAELIVNIAYRKQKYWADELEALIQEVKKHEGL